MIKRFAVATLSATVLFATVLSAQPSPKPRVKAGESVTVTGCIAETTGHYMLTQALLVKPAPAAMPVPSGTPEPAQKPRADDQTYELIGAQVKAHAGHRVEITGTMPSAGSDGNAPASADPARTAHPIAGTVTVKSVKMLSKTCP